jgi:hypothetical protein
MTENYSMPILINGHQEMIDNYVKDHWKPYLMSFMYKPLHGNMNCVLEMQREIYRCYCILIKRFARNPRSPYSQEYLLPKLFAFPDRPVPKHAKKSRADVIINGGLHFQGIILLPPASRFKECLAQFLERKQSCFVNLSGKLTCLYAKEITHDLGYVVDYAMKSVKRRTVDFEDVLFLPKCVSELPSKTKEIDPKEKAIKDLQSHWNCSEEVAESMLNSMVIKGSKAG